MAGKNDNFDALMAMMALKHIIICGTERQSQIQIRSIWGRTDTMSSIRFCQ